MKIPHTIYVTFESSYNDHCDPAYEQSAETSEELELTRNLLIDDILYIEYTYDKITISIEIENDYIISSSAIVNGTEYELELNKIEDCTVWVSKDDYITI